MPTATRRIVAGVALIVSFGLIVVPRRTDAQIATESARKVVNRVVPAYPDRWKSRAVIPCLPNLPRTPFSSASGSLRQGKPGSLVEI